MRVHFVRVHFVRVHTQSLWCRSSVFSFFSFFLFLFCLNEGGDLNSYILSKGVRGEGNDEKKKDEDDGGGGLDPNEMLRFSKEIADGMRHLHANNFVHRDLKSQNILIQGKERTLKICDFGLARIWIRTKAKSTRGTNSGTNSGANSGTNSGANSGTNSGNRSQSSSSDDLTSFGGAVGRGGLFGLDRTLFHSSSSDGRGGLHPYLKDQRQQKEEQKVKMQMTVREMCYKILFFSFFFFVFLSLCLFVSLFLISFFFSSSSLVFFLSLLFHHHHHHHTTDRIELVLSPTWHPNFF